MPDLLAARSRMALSLGWHIVIACIGVGFPLIVLIAGWRASRTGDAVCSALARAWTKALGCCSRWERSRATSFTTPRTA